VCSPEFINGLIDDPRVKQYMSIEQTTGKLWTTGQQFDMFELSFIPTMLDEFAYPDIEFPGVYEAATGAEIIRLYAVKPTGPGTATIIYLDVHQDFVVASGVTAKTNLSGTSYLKDGSAIEEQVQWNIPTSLSLVFATKVLTTGEATSLKVLIRKQARSLNADGEVTYGPLLAVSEAEVEDADGVNDLLAAGEFMQLPIHRGILFGAEALVKLSMEGVSDAPRIIVKALGSSGVADPIDQRQSIGFKVDGFGLAIKRPEAIVVTFGIPRYAELAALTEKVVFRNYKPSYLEDAEEDTFNNHIKADGSAALRVDGVNLGGEPGSPNVAGLNDFKKFVQTDAHVKGEIVLVSNKPYIFLVGVAANTAWTAIRAAGSVKRYVDTLEEAIKVNEEDSNIE
jgi:hypothetical protein